MVLVAQVTVSSEIKHIQCGQSAQFLNVKSVCASGKQQALKGSKHG